MLDNAIRPLATVVAPSPAPTPTAQAKVAAHPFAEVLRQNREAASRPSAPTPASPPPPTAKAAAPRAQESASDDSPATEATGKPRSATAAKPHDAESASDTDSTVSTDAAPTAPTDAESHAKDGDGKEPASTGPDAGLVAAAMANARADVAVKADGSSGGNATGGHGDNTASGDSSRSAAGLPTGAAASSPLDPTASRSASDAAATDRQAGVESARDTSGDKAIDAAPGASFSALLADSKSAHAGSAGVERHGSDNLAPTASTTGFVAAGASNATATTTTATLPTPIHSPEFAAAFGVQVSVLAKDGVQRAELHLNPAEMGPVSIQITLDGSQARVDFGADMAATRHLIEAGLPELASALRDAGFTLAGGGVAEHSTPQGGSGDGSDPARGAAARTSSMQSIGDDAAPARMTRRISAGGVDLYA